MKGFARSIADLDKRVAHISAEMARPAVVYYGTLAEMYDTVPPSTGALWFSTTDNRMYIWDDGEWFPVDGFYSGDYEERSVFTPQRIGTLWWNTDTCYLCFWDGSEWLSTGIDAHRPFINAPNLIGYWPMFPGLWYPFYGQWGILEASGTARHLQMWGSPSYYDPDTFPRDVSVAQMQLNSDEAGWWTQLDDNGNFPPIGGGITLGGWIYHDAWAGRGDMLWGIYNVESYYDEYLCWCQKRSSIDFFVRVSGGAGDYPRATVPPDSYGEETGVWNFIVCRYSPTALTIYMDGEVYDMAPHPLRDYPGYWEIISDAEMRFHLGYVTGGRAQYCGNFDGRMSNVFMSGVYLTDGIVDMMYRRSRGAYGV